VLANPPKVAKGLERERERPVAERQKTATMTSAIKSHPYLFLRKKRFFFKREIIIEHGFHWNYGEYSILHFKFHYSRR
jgi:hypothetical protein